MARLASRRHAVLRQASHTWISYPYTTSVDVNRVILTDITLERPEDGRLSQLARLALIVAEFGVSP